MDTAEVLHSKNTAISHGQASPIQMSGIFLTVWSEDEKVRDTVLKTTPGGYPHVTFAYLGKTKTKEELDNVACDLMRALSLTAVTLDRVAVNTFHWEKHNRDRHDVLMYLSDESADVIQLLRTMHGIPEREGQPDTHVTHMVDCGSAEEAEAVAANIRSLLPLRLTYNGVTID